ncbi:Ig-like domain-containing protein [Gottfriedia sp. NPDC056225]|uniref:Ig-like domain-containing protein n=1 Tax=Gottfriedia sp. NPDC056225 TaxID=3345751 RepID=UPI0035D97F56
MRKISGLLLSGFFIFSVTVPANSVHADSRATILGQPTTHITYDNAGAGLNSILKLSESNSNATISTQLNDSLGFLLSKVPNPSFGTISGEWSVLSLARGNYNVPVQYFVNYYNRIVDQVKSDKGVLSTSKNTEYSRLILALSALGKDPTNVGGYNLLTPLADYSKTIYQGINGGIFALIAFDSNHYEIPTIADSTKQATREKYIDFILSKEIKKGTDQAGGFALSGSAPDPDITAMALQALAPYESMPEVSGAIDRAVTALSNLQNTDGGFTAWGSTSSESIAQAIVALTALGVNPATDSRFVKPNGNLVTALLKFYVDGGGFKHVLEGSADGMATDQGAYALESYDRFLNGKNSLYNMTDAPVTIVTKQINGLPATIALVDEPAIVAARTAYDGLGLAQKGLVASVVLDRLVDAEDALRALKNETTLVDLVVNQINALPTTITLANEASVVSARKAYDGLTHTQKEKVSINVLNKLVAAETAITTLKNQAKASEVQNKINALPSQIKLTNESAIVAARAAYNGLTAPQKAFVSSTALTKLVSAEKIITNLKNAAKAVKDKISALPTVGSVRLTSETAIKAARSSYNALDSNQKTLVGSISKLTAAEARLALIKADKTLPTIKGVTNNAYYKVNKTVQISDNVGILTATYTINGKSYPYSSSKVYSASAKYTVTVTDLKGNKRTVVFYIDKKAPTKPSVKSISSSTTKVTGKAEGYSTIYILQGSKKIGTSKVSSSGAYSVKIAKLKKKTKLTIYVVDRAGNKSANTIVTVK